jgi:hypothetical protein
MFNITPTEELKALKEIDLMDSNANMGLNQLKFYASQSYNAFWYGDISPIIKVGLLGTNALEIFTTSLKTQMFIKELDPEWIILEVPTQYTVVWVEDGSAEIIESTYE